MGIRGRALFVVALLVAGALSPAISARATNPPAPTDVDPDSLLVRLAPGGASALDDRGLRDRKAVGRSGYLEVNVAPSRLEETRRALAADRRVAAVQYNHIYRAMAAPNDPRFNEQTALARVRAPQAWDEQPLGPGAGQVIAILDSGVDSDHPDLDDQLLPGADFVDDSDGDFEDDDPNTNGDLDPEDEHGHGTLVAGVAAAETNNGEGIAGVAHAAKILPVRVLNRRAMGTEADIAEGIDFATASQAKVINLSLGSLARGAVMEAAVQRAITAGAVVVSATGNFGAPIPTYPAAFPGVLAVGAIDDGDGVTWFSEYGDWVDLVAPGVNVLSTFIGGDYIRVSGTSFSAPLAAGAAAMVRAGSPSISPAEVVSILRASAQDASHAGFDPYYGAGILDAYAALGGEMQQAVPIAPGDAHEGSAPTVLSLSAQGTASINTATISPEGDVDTFAFDVPAAGSLVITAAPGDSPMSNRWLDPVLTAGREGGPMTELDDRGPLAPEYLTLEDVTAGRYVASVRNFNASRTAPYTLAVYFFAAPPPQATTAATSPPTTAPAPPAPPPPPRSGYWMLDESGRVYPFGDAGWFGDGGPRAVDIEATPSGDGYWIVDQHTSIYARGDAPYLGGTRRLESGELVTSISRTRSGQGVWLFTNRGRVLTYGDARHFGDMSGTPLNGPVLDSIPTPTGNGYYMVASDGGVFAFGDAVFAGSMGDTPLNQPVQSLVPDVDNRGYWLVAADGGIFAFDAGFFGSMGDTRLNKPITGMVRSSTGNGYLMVAEDGGIFAFGDARFHGSLGDHPPAMPITSVAYLAD